MYIVYNSDNYCVVAYPNQDGYELVDKTSGLGTFIRGDVAAHFRDSIRDAVAQDLSTDRIDEYIGHFSALMTQPVVYH